MQKNDLTIFSWLPTWVYVSLLIISKEVFNSVYIIKIDIFTSVMDGLRTFNHFTTNPWYGQHSDNINVLTVRHTFIDINRYCRCNVTSVNFEKRTFFCSCKNYNEKHQKMTLQLLHTCTSLLYSKNTFIG